MGESDNELDAEVPKIERHEPLSKKKKAWRQSPERRWSLSADTNRPPLERREMERKKRKDVMRLEAELIEAKKEKKRTERARKEERAKRRKENELKSAKLQVVSTAKVKKMSRKERQNVVMVDPAVLEKKASKK